MRKYLKYGVLGLIVAIFSVLLLKPESPKEQTAIPRTYEEIIRSGVIRAVTEYNSISFHAEGDTISGLHYELLQAFAQSKGLTVEITPEMSVGKRDQGIQDGTYDLLANHVLISKDRTDSLLFTQPILLSRQILVQRKAQSPDDSTHINSLLDLAQKTVHIVKDSPFILRIQNLSNEIGDTIYVQEIEKYGQEQLLAMVAAGDIDYAICDEGIVVLAGKDFPQLDMEKAISFTQFYSWGMHKKNTTLLDSLNSWLESYKKTPAFQQLMKKYSTNTPSIK